MIEHLDQLHQFHWLRPWWLLGIPAAALLCLLLLRWQARSHQWQQIIDPDLLPHLLQGKFSRPSRWPLLMLMLSLWLGSLAMAGPAWEKLPQPVHKAEAALVILLDLSPSMLAQDVKPSRLIRARLKLIDLLKERREGLSALIAYAGEAHVVTPLTDDNATIISLLPSLSPQVMPLQGSNTEMALDQALRLLSDAGIVGGEILLVTDGVTDEAADYLKETLPYNTRLSVLGVGSDEGAPIPIANGGFVKDRDGAIVLARLGSGELTSLATAGGGQYRTLSADDSDIRALAEIAPELSDSTRELQREFDAWLDRGAWVTLLLLPFAALAFRRGWLLCLPFVMLLTPEPAAAFSWDDLWLTPDQQGQKLLEQGQPQAAAEQFKRQDWAAAAHYKANNYEQAAEAFAEQDSASGHYNRGNALARSGKLREALDAYDEALKKQPDMEDAAANRQLVEDLLNQQQQQQNQQQNQQQDQQQNQDKQQDQQQNQDGQENQNDSVSDQNSQQSDAQQNSQDPSQNQSQDQSQPSEQQPSDGQDQEQNPSQNQPDQQQSQQDESQQSQPPQSPQPGEEAPEGTPQEQSAVAETQELSDEEKQAMEQWLRKIPDDPSGLMREKFKHQYRQRRKEYQQGTWQPPENEANKRW
ncbi:VWA domain-containing protein [Pseudomaricurvus alkylphenolicus]|uniref:vWA domain-containing protein n=1 Tax=Pseudomaricurvus alkylphenolicus TaxID=1306991 RepID=UPI001423139A|nr:VWA domain-containing protein [Pseudomaricurvus alkylphenolicus]NIB44566.1 VWA domain-containing protein [Pseudomaricurvus alkylphenolicus]